MWSEISVRNKVDDYRDGWGNLLFWKCYFIMITISHNTFVRKNPIVKYVEVTKEIKNVFPVQTQY